MNPVAIRLSAAISIVSILALPACTASGDTGGKDNVEKQEVIELHAVGADSMESLLQCWAGAHRAEHSNISITFTSGLSADGAFAMIEHRAELSPFAREFFPAEVTAFDNAFSESPILVRVAGGSFSERGKTHAIAIYVHRDNPLESLTLAQLQATFAGGKPLQWGDLGLSGEWQEAGVHTYGMLNLRESGNPPGIVNFLRGRINAGKPLDDSITQFPGTDEVHALQQIVDAVAMDRFGIGYGGFGFENADSKAVALRDSSGVTTSGAPASVASHDYALSRYVYMAIRPNPGPEKSAAVANFMHTVLGVKGQDCIRIDASGFNPLPSDIRMSEQVKVRRRLAPGLVTDKMFGKGYWTQDGKVRVIGYNDMEHILLAIGERFSELHPGIEFELDLRGTRTAPPALMAGRSAFAPMGAEFSDVAPEDLWRPGGTDPLAIRVAHASLNPKGLSGPLAFFVHTDNPLESISMSAARRVFAPRDGEQPIKHWGQLGLDGEWHDRPIRPCGLAPDTPLANFLRTHKFDNDPYANDVTGFRQSNHVVRFAADNVNALCFAAHNRRIGNVKALDVSEVDGGPAIEATAETIVAGRYPLDRYLYIYVRNLENGGIDPLVLEYLKLVLSPTGQAIIAASPQGYLPLNSREVEKEVAKLLRY